MTYHEMLAVVAIAEDAHRRPFEQGGHGGELNLHCFLTALRENARPLGFPPGFLLNQFKARFHLLVKRGWIVVCDSDCGGDHFAITEKGREQLATWTREGCAAHAGNRPIRDRECAAGAVRATRADGSPLYAKAGARE